MKKILAVMLSVGMCTSAFASSDGFDEYLNKLRAEARDKGISEQVISAAFADVEYKPRAVKADRNQPEKKLTLDEYIPRAVPEWKVKQAKQLYKEHYAELKRIGDEFGVQPRFIVALWGVESNFGKFTGNFRVIDALSTMAFEGRREEFFRKETMAALQILDEGHIELENFKGSWAGAMGQCQFMPSSFLRFAADGNGDGKKDIWQSEADVFASTANYLANLAGMISSPGVVRLKCHTALTTTCKVAKRKKVSICKSGASLASPNTMAAHFLSWTKTSKHG